jgi:hypothetical protein
LGTGEDYVESQSPQRTVALEEEEEKEEEKKKKKNPCVQI